MQETRPKILITEFMDDAAVAALAREFDVHYDKSLVDRPDELESLAAECRAVIVRNRTQVRGRLLESARHLAVVGRLGVGLDNIDLAACEKRGIRVIPATGANVVSVAEYVMAAMLMLARGCYGMSTQVASGAWPREKMFGGELYGHTLGLLGFGSIARAVAGRARAFDMQIAAYDPYLSQDDPAWEQWGVAPLPLEDVLASSDFLSIHVPLTDGTRHLVSAERLALMKPTAFLVNTSRGGVVDDTALAGALTEGRLKGAMLDVFEEEPLSADTPIAQAPNCLFTAHIAGVTNESNTRVSVLIAERVAECLRKS